MRDTAQHAGRHAPAPILDAVPSPSVMSCWASGDVRELPRLLAEQVIFRSPAHDYHGHADAAHMLTLIPTVLHGFHVTAAWADDTHGTLSTFEARHDDHRLDGVLHEVADDRGLLTRVTLFLRPYAALTASMAAMRAQLETRPLPSRATD